MYVDVILPIAIPELFSYLVDNKEIRDQIKIGSIVAVAIGKRKISGAVVVAIHNEESARELKPILNIIDSDSVITPKQLEFWWWLSSYYLCTMGEVYDQFLPTSLKPRTNYEIQDDQHIYKFPKIYGFKEVDYIYLNPAHLSEASQCTLLETYKRSKAKLKLITIILEQTAVGQDDNAISKSAIQDQGITNNIISDLIKESIVLKETRKIKISQSVSTYTQIYEPSENNITAEVDISFSQRKTSLLKSSNSTTKQQTCIHLINNVLKNGGEVLFISPTTFSATEINSKFAELFGDNFIQYDKKKNKNSQHIDYTRILENSGSLLVSSTRIGVGLPFKNLQLVIVDDEHDATYLGYEYDISYNGRDAAIYLAHLHGAKTLLVSPTPSIESYHNCMQGKFTLIEERNSFYPKINIIERSTIARNEYKLYDSSSSRRYISKLLIKEIEERISRGEITFLYQNRKGFATVVECAECGEYVQCSNCNATLTYHKSTNDLRCRYCLSRYNMPQKCTSCSSPNLRLQGIGTENVEQKVSELFPLAKVVRLDTDIMDNRTEFKNTLSNIYAGKVDIIVGTQLVTKMREIPNLTLIGVINGDNMFAFPDYRTGERTFQTLSSLAMKLPNDKNSLMIVQMSHRTGITKFLCQNDYHSLYKKEIEERDMFSYPPFCKLITFTLKHTDIDKLTTTADQLCNALTTIFVKRVTGVVTPQVDRIRREYIRQIVIKIETGANLQRAKDLCRESVKKYAKGIKVAITTV